MAKEAPKFWQTRATRYTLCQEKNFCATAECTKRKDLRRIFLSARKHFPVHTFPTLRAHLFATPNHGDAPLNNVALTADVMGIATGPISYYFFQDNASDNTSTDNADDVYINVNNAQQTSQPFSYDQEKIYYARKI